MKYFVVIFLVCLPAVLCASADRKQDGLLLEVSLIDILKGLAKLPYEVAKPFAFLRPQTGKKDNAIVEPQQKPQPEEVKPEVKPILNEDNVAEGDDDVKNAVDAKSKPVKAV